MLHYHEVQSKVKQGSVRSFMKNRNRRRKMKKVLWLATTAVLVLMLGVYIGHAQPMGPGMMGPGYGYGSGMGPGMMGPGYGYGYGMGPGMMGPGYGYGSGMGPGMMGPGYGYGYGMGPGMMGPGYGYGSGMGPGMMGPGYGYSYGPQYGYGPQYQQPSKPLDKDQARQEIENYLKTTRNPNLSLGKIEEKGNDYEADIQTKNGALVDKILVDKNTGSMRSAY
jgi:hypothetical protein